MAVKGTWHLLGLDFTSGKHVRAMNTPIYPTFIAKLGYAGVYLFFLFLLQNIDCGTRRF